MKLKSRLLLTSVLAGVLLLALVISFSDLTRLVEIAENLQPGWVLASLISAVVSIVIVSFAFMIVLRSVTGRSGGREIMKTVYVSFTVGYVFASWGISGFAVRAYLLSATGISYAETLICTLAHAALHYLALFIIFVTAVFVFLPSIPPGVGQTAVIVQVTVFALILAYAVRFLASSTARDRWVKGISFVVNRLWSALGKGDLISREGKNNFTCVLEKAVRSVRSKKTRLIPPFLLGFVVWGFVFLTLYSGFRACQYRVEPGVLISGFIIGTFWIAFVLLPGHLGILEGSISTVYFLFGVPFAVAVATSLVYRVACYIFPFLVGFLLLPSLMRKAFTAGFKDGAKSAISRPEGAG